LYVKHFEKRSAKRKNLSKILSYANEFLAPPTSVFGLYPCWSLSAAGPVPSVVDQARLLVPEVRLLTAYQSDWHDRACFLFCKWRQILRIPALPGQLSTLRHDTCTPVACRIVHNMLRNW